MKFKFLLFLLILVLSGCSGITNPELPGATNDLKDLGPAPELTNDTWLNTNQPLRLADLRGQVVLLDMWTYG